MKNHPYYRFRLVGPAVLAGLLASGAAGAENTDTSTPNQPNVSAGVTQTKNTEEAREATEQVSAATHVISSMKQQAGVESLLERANGLFIVPKYGRGAAVVGARGGEGVLVVRNEDSWSGPAFYDYGGLSIGAQAGGKGGSLVMLLMSERAVERFKGDADFSVNADAGLTIAEYSEAAQASLPNKDIVVWSDTEGLFAGAAIGVTGVRRDTDDNRAYYNQAATVEQIFMGSVTNPHAQELHDELPDRVAAR
ncbi:MAG: lipid-binding SYLF domain-containing protein [Pseudomonadota bacterium]|nr:lipid-binding SYLF domain-containing protein [Pseudomonadota bacterium]